MSLHAQLEQMKRLKNYRRGTLSGDGVSSMRRNAHSCSLRLPFCRVAPSSWPLPQRSASSMNPPFPFARAEMLRSADNLTHLLERPSFQTSVTAFQNSIELY